MSVGFIDAAGKRQEVSLDATLFREASVARLSVPAYLAKKYETDESKYGSVFKQLCASAGMFVKGDASHGISPTTMQDIFSDGIRAADGGTISRNSEATSAARRVLFPVTILGLIEDKLKDDKAGYVGMFNNLVAVTNPVDGARFEQPKINFSGPEGATSQAISQGTRPASMVSISTSEISRRIATYSIGLEITDQARNATTLDLVRLALDRQFEVEQAALVDRAILALLQGDLDFGSSALTAVKASSFDSTISASGQLTHKALIKWMYAKRYKRTISHVICNLDTYLAIENRTGRPLATGDGTTEIYRATAEAEIMNNGWNNVKVFLSETVPANTIIGLDARYAIAKAIDVNAAYEAMEAIAMKRTTEYRVDWGWVAYRQFDDAFDVLSLVP